MLPKPIVYRGKTYSSKAELCREFGMGVATLNYRLRSGCTVEEAVEKELDTGVKVVFQGTEYPSIKALAKELDLPYSRLSHYYGRSRDIGESVERCRKEAGRGIELWGKQYRGIPEIAVDFGVRYASLVQRLRDGMELPEAVRHLLRTEGVTFAGKKYENFVDLCGEYHIQPANVYGRLKQGFTLTEALTRPLGKAGHGNAMWYEGVAYDSQRALCQAYGISVDCVREQTKRHPFSFMDSFENLKRLKEYAGMPWGEEMNYIPACRVRGKNYKTAASFVRQFGITSSMLSAYKYKKGIRDLFETLRSMQKETRKAFLLDGEPIFDKDLRKRYTQTQIDQMHLPAVFVPRYPGLQGFDFETGCLDLLVAYEDMVAELENRQEQKPMGMTMT